MRTREPEGTARGQRGHKSPRISDYLDGISHLVGDLILLENNVAAIGRVYNQFKVPGVDRGRATLEIALNAQRFASLEHPRYLCRQVLLRF
jgi:hypothetical protein